MSNQSNTRVLLIYPNITHQEAISPGLAYISGWLKKNHDYNIKLFDLLGVQRDKNATIL